MINVEKKFLFLNKVVSTSCVFSLSVETFFTFFAYKSNEAWNLWRRWRIYCFCRNVALLMNPLDARVPYTIHVYIHYYNWYIIERWKYMDCEHLVFQRHWIFLFNSFCFLTCLGVRKGKRQNDGKNKNRVISLQL